MKPDKNTILLLIILVVIVAFFVGRVRRPVQLAQGWTPPVRVTDSQNADVGGGDLYKWHDTLILLKDQYNRGAKSSTCSVMIRNNDASNSWTQLPGSGVSGGYAFCRSALDLADDRALFTEGYIENDQLFMRAVFVRMTGSGGIQVEAERKWTMDQKSLFGETGPNVKFNGPSGRLDRPNRESADLGPGVLNGSEVYVPYALHANTSFGINNSSNGPFNNGVFHSTDSGANWQMERISDFDAGAPAMCRTKNFYYYFAFKDGDRTLWFSRKPVSGSSWDEPKLLTKTFANRRGGGPMAENDTVYFCWLDRRHEKWRFNIEDPYVGNYEVAYCRRKDSDSTWRKDVILSRGLLFSYSPSMSVEGDKIVVAWESGESNKAWQSYDIYYATSKNGGKTWTRPLKVTDRAKDGITSENPQVAVQNGVTHLFYAQGKRDRNSQVWNQGGWPVYYQQRPFPD